jgi:predicted DNA-binding transcriptional regulator YafY
MRTYKIAKIQNIELLDEDFAYPEAFDLASHWRDELKRFERSLRQGEATLRISPAALSRIDRLGANVAETVLSVPPDADGWRLAVVPIESIDYAAGLLLGFADDIEVIKPAQLRERLAEHAGRIVALYGNGGQSGPAAASSSRPHSLERAKPQG